MSTDTQVRPGRVLPRHVTDQLGERARALDGGEGQARAVFPLLGTEGLLGLGAPRNADGRLVDMVAVIAELAEGCLASAFATWAQRMVVEYLSEAATPYAAEQLPSLLSGGTPGVTAMAPAFRDLAGCGTLEVIATPDGDGYQLDGPVRWASNLYPDALLVTAAQTPAGRKLVVALPLASAGITVGDPFSLVALGSTESSYLHLDAVRLDAANVLSDDLAGFLPPVRGTFLSLQSAFCVGLATASYEAVRASLTGMNEVFADQADALGDDLCRVRSTLERTARSVGTSEQAPREQLLGMRLDAAGVATTAAALESRTAGGKGYLDHSAAGRRLRESAFIPVQSPSEAQLRWELASADR